jgi:hypothetical protein
MKEFDQFVSLWKEETESIKIKKDFKHMLFLVVCPDKLKWDFGIEKQIQTTTLMMSGGATGAGCGHDIRFCYRSEVHNLLLECNHTHAMIVSVGMVFDMVGFGGRKRVTSITDFYNFVKSKEFCKTHIIANPNQQAYFHHQHMNLNLTIWKNVGAPDMSKKYDVIERSSDNFHDDYTPSWINVKGLPTIINFTNEERKRKSFSYYKNNQSKFWRNLDNVDMQDYYFSRFMTRIRKQFYIENTEHLKNIPKEKFDLIITTTAGYRAAVLFDKLEFDGDVVLYDYCQENIDIKQMIIEMNMSLEEINLYSKTVNHFMVSPDFTAKHSIKSMGSFEDLRKLEEKMYNSCDIEYWLMNLISPNYDRLLEKIQGKTVFFDATNIFSYHMSHAYYTLDELVSSYKKLHGVLKLSNKTYFRGTKPTKQKGDGWIS